MKPVFSRFLSRVKHLSGVEKELILLGSIHAGQNRQVEKFNSLKDTEFSVFSQWGEDGIIDFLVGETPIKEDIFIEIGTEDYSEANTRFLLQKNYWRGLIIDGSEMNMENVNKSAIAYKYDLRTLASFVTRDNVCDLISEDRFNERAGLLSIDIDGVDYWVLEAIPDTPEIIIVEYNDLFDPALVSVPYDPSFVRTEKHHSNLYWGASLSAFRYLLEPRGYVFVGSNGAGTNAFFVKKEVSEGVTKKLKNLVAWPSQMREARDKKGNLILKDRKTLLDQIYDLPLVRVDTNETVSVKEALS